jgi:hypothetical protein
LYSSEDYYQIKGVDRGLSYFLVDKSCIVCDVGGSAGIDALNLARLASFCVSIDTDEAMVHTGLLDAKKSLQDNVDFIVADARQMPFKDRSFDLITCFSVLDHIPTKQGAYAAIHEFSRVVKKSQFVAITLPNKLFLPGTITMKIKWFLDSDAFFEKRYTPKELRKILISAELEPLVFDSRYPTTIGNTVLRYNLPNIAKKIPANSILLYLAGKFFERLQRFSSLKLYGARFGYLSQKK